MNATITEFQWHYRRLGDAAYIRKQLKKLCLQRGFSKLSTDEILLALTEMLTNVTKYADNNATVHARPWYQHERLVGIEITVSDQGPGIKDLEDAMKDGYTTTRSLGLGLGAIRRLSDELEIYSWSEKKQENYFNTHEGRKRHQIFPRLLHQKQKRGTTIIFRRKLGQRSRVNKNEMNWWWNVNSQNSRKIIVVGKSLPRVGSIHNDDGIYWNEQKKTIFISILDGLGHGRNARQATQQAIDVMRKRHHYLPLTTLMKILHHQLKETNGCQIMLVRIDTTENTCTYLGVGNIRGYIIKRTSIKSLLTKDGIVGKILPSLTETTIPFTPPSLIILHTDGIDRSWTSEVQKMNLFRFRASDLVNDLMVLHRKQTDDSAVVVIQNVKWH